MKLPKDALSKIDLGQSFAEYDKLLRHPEVFVITPAIKAATETSRSKCFFVGRRGTGKTAITFYLTMNRESTIQLHPQVFSPIGLQLDNTIFKDTRQKPFKSLVYSFKRALLDEVLLEWYGHNIAKRSIRNPQITHELEFIENTDFDERVKIYVDDFLTALKNADDFEWMDHAKRHKLIAQEITQLATREQCNCALLIDRVDESWDGSDNAVNLLMALMHACVELSSSLDDIRPLLFLRENIFERVRQIDNEFARLETCVVSLDWSKELLLELVERRLNLPFNTRLSLHGPTWDYFFESIAGASSRELVFDYCQQRPRDVLTYCSFAIESAQSHRHEKVRIEDLQSARRRFSDSRLKDLGDEYAENFPIQLILARFYGLGKEFTIPGVEAFVKKLLVDEEIKIHCATWLYRYTAPHLFVELLYNIGFVGIREKDGVIFRSLGPKSSTPPGILSSSTIVVHPTYCDALNLQNIIVGSLDENVQLKKSGLVTDLPDAIALDAYQERLKQIEWQLGGLSIGNSSSNDFEGLVGDIIRLCFFRSLTNVEPRVRDVDGRVIRDWVAANRASQGFWEMVRHRYKATQVLWECKNYEELTAEDFHQFSYYMNEEIGDFVVVAYRGDEKKKHYFQHIKRISNEKRGGIVLLLSEKDLKVFLRQAYNGKIKEDHIQDLYDHTVREIS